MDYSASPRLCARPKSFCLSLAFPRRNPATVPEPALNMLKGQAQSLSGTVRRNRRDNGWLMDVTGIRNGAGEGGLRYRCFQ